MVRGSCPCGGIKFEIEKVRALTNCHCSVCRKSTGASFSTKAHVRSERFKMIAGEDLIDPGFEWMLGHARSFCKRCGSPAPKFVEATGMVSVPAGLIEDDPGVRLSMHVFTSSMMPWVELNDDLPKYEKWVPGFVPKDLG
ncbi:MAG TPA: GFA family protein [Candidatus Binataceae bacterium]|nr:GFA family protein [Candidatus Binataceae bacterium]